MCEVQKDFFFLCDGDVNEGGKMQIRRVPSELREYDNHIPRFVKFVK